MKLIDNALLRRVGEFLGAVFDFCENEKTKIYWAMAVLVVVGVGLVAVAAKFHQGWALWVGLVLAAPGLSTLWNGYHNDQEHLRRYGRP